MNSSVPINKLHFPSVIGRKDSELKKIIGNIDKFYREWYEPKTDKVTGVLKRYKDGTVKTRPIRPSKPQLSIIQSKIKDRILSKIELPDNIHGGRKKHSNITNAKPHQGKKYIFTTDLQDFYPSIKSRMIFDTFIELGFNPQFAFYITRLTTWKGELPQGTPTSTHISNVVFLKTDYKLIELCKTHNITYTRYIDDLTFSAPYDFQNVIEEILNIIQQSGLKISRRKTEYGYISNSKLNSKKSSPTITGIKIYLNKIDASDKIMKHVKKEELLPEDVIKPYTIYRNNIIKTNTPRRVKSHQ